MPESELKHILWQAFHSGGLWALDAQDKKNDQSPMAAFEAWFSNTDPLMAHREDLRDRLRAIRYQSLAGRGERGLMEHHVDAIIDGLTGKTE